MFFISYLKCFEIHFIPRQTELVVVMYITLLKPRETIIESDLVPAASGGP